MYFHIARVYGFQKVGLSENVFSETKLLRVIPYIFSIRYTRIFHQLKIPSVIIYQSNSGIHLFLLRYNVITPAESI